jgi:hypothetical protein
VAHVKRAAPGRTDTGRCRDGPGSTFLSNQPIRSRRLGNAHLDVQARPRGHVDEGVRPEAVDLAAHPARAPRPSSSVISQLGNGSARITVADGKCTCRDLLPGPL